MADIISILVFSSIPHSKHIIFRLFPKLFRAHYDITHWPSSPKAISLWSLETLISLQLDHIYREGAIFYRAIIFLLPLFKRGPQRRLDVVNEDVKMVGVTEEEARVG